MGTTTCTIAQIMKAEYNEETSKYTMDGAPLAVVAVVGEVVDIEETATYTKITLEDGTGQVIAKKWNSSETPTTAMIPHRKQISAWRKACGFVCIAASNSSTAHCH